MRDRIAYYPAAMGDSSAESPRRMGCNEASAPVLWLDIRGRNRAVPRRNRRGGRHVLAFLQGLAGLFAVTGLRTAGNDAGARHGRLAGGGVRPRAAALSADPGDPQA